MKRFTIVLSVMLLSGVIFAQSFQANPKSKNLSLSKNSSKAVVGTLQWCAEDNGNGVGTGGAGTFSCAAEFAATDLASYDGKYITKIHVGIAAATDITTITSGKVAILTGDLSTGPVIAYQQTATFVVGWNEILLSVPYQITASTPIYVAYEVVITGGYPLGMDAGPDVPKGNWIAMSALPGTGWGHLSALAASLTYNHSIKATVDDDAGAASMIASPSDLYFIGYAGAGATAAEVAVAQAVGLTSSITATATTGFEISSDGTTYAATATLPAAGGSLSVRFIPGTVFGQSTGTVTFSNSAVADAVVNLTALTYDCQGVVVAPYTEDFYASEQAGCWTVIDANADDTTFVQYYSDGTGTASDLAYVYSYSTASVANDWLISPKLTMPTNAEVKFDYRVQTATTPYPEKFEVYVITGTPQDYATGTQVLTTQTVQNPVYATQTIDLSTYVGQDVYVGIKCVSAADQWRLYIDNFILNSGTSVSNNSLNAISVYPNPANDVVYVSENANITVINMLGQVVATAANANQVNVSELSAGNYIVKVQNNNVSAIKNITIVK